MVECRYIRLFKRSDTELCVAIVDSNRKTIINVICRENVSIYKSTVMIINRILDAVFDTYNVCVKPI